LRRRRSAQIYKFTQICGGGKLTEVPSLRFGPGRPKQYPPLSPWPREFPEATGRGVTLRGFPPIAHKPTHAAIVPPQALPTTRASSVLTHPSISNTHRERSSVRVVVSVRRQAEFHRLNSWDFPGRTAKKHRHGLLSHEGSCLRCWPCAPAKLHSRTTRRRSASRPGRGSIRIETSAARVRAKRGCARFHLQKTGGRLGRIPDGALSAC